MNQYRSARGKEEDIGHQLPRTKRAAEKEITLYQLRRAKRDAIKKLLAYQSPRANREAKENIYWPPTASSQARDSEEDIYSPIPWSLSGNWWTIMACWSAFRLARGN